MKPYRNKKILKWAATDPCHVTGVRPAEPHHEPLNGHGMASKGPDTEVVPLSHDQHMRRHTVGFIKYWADMFPVDDVPDGLKKEFLLGLIARKITVPLLTRYIERMDKVRKTGSAKT